MVTLFVVVAYLYIRRPGQATGALLVLGSGLLSSDLAIEIGVSAMDARGGLVLWLYVFNTQVVYVMGWARLLAFVVLFPRPWSPLLPHRWLLPAVCATPVALVIALAVAALGGGAFVSGTLGLLVWFLPQLLFGEGLLPAGPPPGPGRRGPPLQPPPLRRRQNDRGVQHPPTPGGRPVHPLGGLLTVAIQTMQPASASLWLRPPADRASGPGL